MIFGNTPTGVGLAGHRRRARAGIQTLMRRSELAGEPAYGVGLHRIHRESHPLGTTAGAAFEGPLFEAALPRRGSG
jgi:hypothetical protein